MSALVPLPHTLLLLVHLHLLGYPLKEAARYDERLFNPTENSMRERTKAMEDICFFLLSCIEGGRERAKTILPTYPCLQPSDTTAFRISLTKHLESLRHWIVYPNSVVNKIPGIENKQKARDGTDAFSAWWWKDVLVRKSLFEECAGERFERLLLALSTHALLKSSALSQILPADPGPALTNIVATYIGLLARSDSERHTWERSASVLKRRHADLQLLRTNLSDAASPRSSKYDALSTERLLALRDSARMDLLRSSWKGEEGRVALEFLIDLAGLRSWQDKSSVVENYDAETVPGGSTEAESAASAPPLPIAAAQHPARLQSLKAPVFSPLAPTSTLGFMRTTTDLSDNIAESVSARMDAAARVKEALQHALARANSLREQLQKRQATISGAASSPLSSGCPPGLDLPSFAAHGTLDLHATPASASDSAFAILPLSPETAFEERIRQIRHVLLPAYPPIPPPPELYGGSPTAAAPTSRLRQPGSWQIQGRAAPKAEIRALRPALGSAGGVSAPKTAGRMASRRISRRAHGSVAVRRDTIDAEIDKIVDAVQDESASFEAGVTQTSMMARSPFAMGAHDAALLDVQLGGIDVADELPDGSVSQRVDGDWMGAEAQEDERYEGHSISLKDILLKAGEVAHFDLLGHEGEHLDEDSDWA